MVKGAYAEVEPQSLSLVTETPTRRIEQESIDSFLEAIADLPRPLSSMTVLAKFNDGAKIEVELSHVVAKVSADGPVLEWVQRKPGEIKVWFRSRALWYSPFKPALLTCLLASIVLISLIAAYLLAPPGWAQLPIAAQRLTLSQFFSTIIIGIIGFYVFIKLDRSLPKCLITDRKQETSKISAQVTAISSSILALFAILTFVLLLVQYLHPIFVSH